MSNFRKSDPSEIQNRIGLDHTRVYDPEGTELLTQILVELQKLNSQLSYITEEDNAN